MQIRTNRSPESRHGSEPGLVFVVGPARCGTTLVARILGRNKSIHSPGETHFFEDVWSRRDRWTAQNGQPFPPDQLLKRVLTLFGRFNFPESQRRVERSVDPSLLAEKCRRLGGDYRGLYLAFMRSVAREAGKQIACDDTPKHLFHLDTIRRYFPRAPIVGCIRDPRDYLSSYKNYYRRSPDVDRVKALYHPVITSLLWYGSARKLIAAQEAGDANLALVRYEDMVSRPERETRRLCEFVGCSYSPEMLHIGSDNSSYGPHGGGIFSTSVGKWRQNLEPSEAWWAQTLPGQTLGKLGYQREQIEPESIHLIRDAAATPYALCRALWMNRSKVGPIHRYLARRIAALLR